MRYNNSGDIIDGVRKFKCSDTHVRSRIPCSRVLVIPTRKLWDDCPFAIYARAVSEQYELEIRDQLDWPSEGTFEWRIELDELRLIDLRDFRHALVDRGNWSYSPNVFPIKLEEDDLVLWEETGPDFEYWKKEALKSPHSLKYRPGAEPSPRPRPESKAARKKRFFEELLEEIS